MVYVNFSASISPKTSQALMNCLADLTNRGEKEIYILLSSTGGSVAFGISLHNFIKALPAKIIMHNIGVVNSIANVVFLAGEERYAVTHSSFLFHGVGFDITKPTRFEEKQVRERLLGIQKDQEAISKIVASRTRLTEAEVGKMFFEAQTKTPKEAKKMDIIHDIRDAKIPKGSKVISLVVA